MRTAVLEQGAVGIAPPVDDLGSGYEGARMSMAKMANLTLAFLLELCMLGALGYWGFTVGGDTIMKVALGIGAPLLAAVVWGMFLAPKSIIKMADPWHLLLKIAVFGAAVAALFAAGQPGPGWALAIAFAVNTVLLYVWK